jgi:hypothetical protein
MRPAPRLPPSQPNLRPVWRPLPPSTAAGRGAVLRHQAAVRVERGDLCHHRARALRRAGERAGVSGGGKGGSAPAAGVVGACRRGCQPSAARAISFGAQNPSGPAEAPGLTQAPTTTPPRPAPTTTPPRPAPTITPPRPAPTATPPRPAPTATPPRPAPTATPPRPAPTATPPRPAPTHTHTPPRRATCP